jgi:hypothetical protein
MVGPSLIGSGRGLFISILVRDLILSEKNLLFKSEQICFLNHQKFLSHLDELKKHQCIFKKIGWRRRGSFTCRNADLWI